MTEIDKWAAEQCGITLSNNCFDDQLTSEWPLWTIQDPRCREIVRERFCIETIRTFGFQNWYAYSSLRLAGKDGFDAEGKTIAEAEIACIEAIYEAR